MQFYSNVKRNNNIYKKFFLHTIIRLYYHIQYIQSQEINHEFNNIFSNAP